MECMIYYSFVCYILLYKNKRKEIYLVLVCGAIKKYLWGENREWVDRRQGQEGELPPIPFVFFEACTTYLYSLLFKFTKNF